MFDNKTVLMLELFIREADPAAYAYYRETTDEVMLVPAGMPQLNGEVVEQMKQGFVWVGLVGLMKRDTPDGNARVSFQATGPAVSEEILEKAKGTFCDQLVELGIIKPEAAAG
jgi:hypothetical protein